MCIWLEGTKPIFIFLSPLGAYKTNKKTNANFQTAMLTYLADGWLAYVKAVADIYTYI